MVSIRPPQSTMSRHEMVFQECHWRIQYNYNYIQSELRSMGGCVSRLRGSRVGEQKGQQDLVMNSMHNNKSSVIEAEQFDQQMPNRRQVKYWARRLMSVSDPSSDDLTQQQMGNFFNYSDFSKETIRKLYLVFKNGNQVLTKQAFIGWLKKIVAIPDAELASVIYSLYFQRSDQAEASLDDFENEFKEFIKGNKQQSYNLNGEKLTSYASKMKQLADILDRRKTTSDTQTTIKWLTKNLRFKSFKSEFLQGGIRADEIAAYKQFWYDYNTNSSSKIKGSVPHPNKDTEVKIINWRWCEKLLKYLDEKYVIEGAPKLRRRQTTDLQSPAFTSMRYKSIMDQKERISQDKRTNFNRSSIRNQQAEETFSSNMQSGYKDRALIKVSDKFVGSGLQFRNHPGEIDNYALLGNFSWELKRNIRKQVDYVTLTARTFDMLVMAFGGGPILERRIVQGYIELRPYFICSYRFNADLVSNRCQLSDEELIKLSSSDLVSSIKFTDPNNSVFYHRNIGEQWSRFQIEIENNNERAMDVFSQTSFLIRMAPSAEPVFKRLYTSKYKTPKIGDKYYSKTYKIIESTEDKITSSDSINVCIVNDQQKGFLEFVVLGWAHHLKRKIPLPEFQRYFMPVENTVLNQTLQKQSRAGISNLGNTCYINAVIQSLLSTFKDSELTSLKGELGVELRQIEKNIIEKKKNVFPVDFKTAFDKYFAYFQGQDQHDAHQFCLSLFEQLEADNREQIKRLFGTKLQLKTTCLKCSKSQEFSEECLVSTLPLRDFAKKKVKVDYITGNKVIQTVPFSIDQDSTVQQWKAGFEQASGAVDYYLCEVENSVITRTFNKSDGLEKEPYHELNIENHFLITAYETKTFQSKLKLETPYTFRSYKSPKTGEIKIARVEAEPAQRDIKSSDDLGEESGRLLKIKVPTGSEFEERIVAESQLLRFPEDFPPTQTYVRIINHDDMYNQNIGRPFVFKIPSHYPIGAVREALEECVGKKGYVLRISPLNEYSRCEICKSLNDLTSKCFMEKQKSAPICWVDGICEFVAVWKDTREYQKLIDRQKSIPSRVNSPSKIEQFDKFDLSLKSFTETEIVSEASCDFCKAKKADCERQMEVKQWPEALIIHLMRFKSTGSQIVKIHTKWKLEESLFIENSKYVLKAVLCHIGTSADFGHYIAISDGTCYDDELVTEMTYDAINPEEIYMLFYRRVS